MSKQPKLEAKEDKFIKISSTGNINLEITLSLSEQEAEIFGVIPEKIESITDCQEFLKPSNHEKQKLIFKKANIYDYLRLSSENVTINSLLVINRAFKKKAFIEFIALSQLKFKNENIFLKEVIKNVSEQNFIFLVENNFLQSLTSKIKFVIKIENRVVKIFENICEDNTEHLINATKEVDENKEDFNKKNDLNDNEIINNINLDNNFFNSKADDIQDQNSQKINESKLSNIKRESKDLINNEIYHHQVNNSKINIRDSSNIIFNENENHAVSEYNMSQNLVENSDNLLIMEDNIISNNKDLIEQNDNKSNLSSNIVELDINAQMQKKESQGDFNDLEKQFKINQNNTENLNKSNFNNNNELDETANKILNSIPNVNTMENMKNNQSRCSNKDIDNIEKKLSEFPNEIMSNNKTGNNNNFNNNLQVDNNSDLDRKRAEEEILIKTKIFNNDINNLDNVLKDSRNSSKNYLEKQKAENVSGKNNEEKKVKTNELKNDGKNKIFEQNEMLTVYERFKYDFSGSDYFFIDMNEMFELKKQNFLITDFHNLLKKITDEQKQITIIINFPNIINNIAFLDLESINILNEIITLTDIFIFDKKDALALFNLMAQINSEDDNYEDKKNLEHLFIKEIKKKRKNHPKIGIFMDELKRVTIIEQQTQSNLILFHTDFELNLIPTKVTKLIAEDYKKLFVVHYEMLKSVFIGGLFSRMLLKKPFNSAFTAGNESLKRVIELLRFNLDPPMDPNFFLIQIKKESKMPNEEEKFKKKKEQHFVLDCANVTTSKMKQYNPLYDNNSSSYFSSNHVRNHLKRLGFINKKGRILQDPDQKKLGIIESKKLNRVYEEEKVNLQKIKDKKEELTLQIKNLLKGNNVMKTGNMKEIEKLAKVYNFNPQAERFLPKFNDFKNSISKKIKINSQMNLKEIYKGKSRSKSKYNSPNRKMGEKESINAKNIKKINHEIYDIVEKIEDKIIYDQLSNTSGNPKIDKQVFSQQKNLIIKNNIDKSNLNVSIRENRGIININTERNLISAKSKSNNSVKIKKEDSSMNRNFMEHDEIPSAKKSEIMSNNILDINILNNDIGENIENSGNFLNNGIKNDGNENNIKKDMNINKLFQDEIYNIDGEQNNEDNKHSYLNHKNLDLKQVSNKLESIENISKNLHKNDDIFTNNELFHAENQINENNDIKMMTEGKKEQDSPKFENNHKANENEDVKKNENIELREDN